MQWEYHIREGNLDIHSLNYLGKEGWEVVNVVPVQSTGNAGQTLIQYEVLFKRPLEARQQTGSGAAATTFDHIAARSLANFDKTFGKTSG